MTLSLFPAYVSLAVTPALKYLSVDNENRQREMQNCKTFARRVHSVN